MGGREEGGERRKEKMNALALGQKIAGRKLLWGVFHRCQYIFISFCHYPLCA